ncbi:unnamed protein product [marine sediment metagenome]|uniref:PD-(D/E)XK endonuclease-like domain-containing protein n=1 Tax=marine sediment metagenome TaxID=412755 RepID=X1TVN4_9ZZZZ
MIFVKKAEFIYSEVPFTINIEPAHSLYAELTGQDSRPVILSGTIDLVFKEADGWVVIDYKTDRPKNEKDYPKLVEVYQKQIAIYSQVWQNITQEKVKEKIIYFLNEQGLFPVLLQNNLYRKTGKLTRFSKNVIV